MISLYLKTHNVTGLKYLGKTIKDPYVYKGSGVYWSNHIEKHGNDVTTKVLMVCDSKDEVKVWGQYYSKVWNIVESKEFANLTIETGLGEGAVGRKYKDTSKMRGENHPHFGKKRSAETKRKVSNSLKGHTPWNKGKTGVYSKETLQKMSVNNGMLGKKHTEATLIKMRAAH